MPGESLGKREQRIDTKNQRRTVETSRKSDVQKREGETERARRTEKKSRRARESERASERERESGTRIEEEEERRPRRSKRIVNANGTLRI